MKNELVYKVTDVDAPKNIKLYLQNNLELSNNFIKRAKMGGVFLNGECVHMRATVNAGDEIRIIIPEECAGDIAPIEIPLEVIYEDRHILAVSKPVGMPMHPCRGNSLPTLANAVSAYLGEDFTFRAIGRLDKDTSGIVIIAKNSFSAGMLGRAMKEGKFEKTYIALVDGVPSENHGIIEAPIERLAEGNIKRGVIPNGKYAKTEYTVIKSNGEKTLVRVKLHTGRTHQIRVHFSHIGHPLYADSLYGVERAGEHYRLHCTELTFPHPDGKIMTLNSKANFKV